jgi:hypothetical protein
MHELRDDPKAQGQQTSNLLFALDAVMLVQKRKVIVGPNDAVGILLINTVRHKHVLLSGVSKSE